MLKVLKVLHQQDPQVHKVHKELKGILVEIVLDHKVHREHKVVDVRISD